MDYTSILTTVLFIAIPIGLFYFNNRQKGLLERIRASLLVQLASFFFAFHLSIHKTDRIARVDHFYESTIISFIVLFLFVAIELIKQRILKYKNK